jgi:hypothetical protein
MTNEIKDLGRSITPPSSRRWRGPLVGFVACVSMLACGGEGGGSSAVPDAGGESDSDAPSDAQRFFENAIAASEQVFASDELMPYFDQLPPVTIEETIGTWRGGKFDGGKPDPIDWWGKQVRSADDALGFLCERDDGTLYSWELLGRASMADEEFRGVTSAALVYDNGFMTDYFRRVSDGVMVGYSPIGYGGSKDLFFHLTRVEDVEVEAD